MIALLNVVINGSMYDDVGTSRALGRDADGDVYLADGSGGYTSMTGGAYSAYGNSETTYMDLAWATGGAAWDLNQLRMGGLTATSFTAAFVDIKVQEIQDQSVPEPGTFALLVLGLAGLVGCKRRRRRA